MLCNGSVLNTIVQRMEMIYIQYMPSRVYTVRLVTLPLDGSDDEHGPRIDTSPTTTWAFSPFYLLWCCCHHGTDVRSICFFSKLAALLSPYYVLGNEINQNRYFIDEKMEIQENKLKSQKPIRQKMNLSSKRSLILNQLPFLLSTWNRIVSDTSWNSHKALETQSKNENSFLNEL